MIASSALHGAASVRGAGRHLHAAGALGGSARNTAAPHPVAADCLSATAIDDSGQNAFIIRNPIALGETVLWWNIGESATREIQVEPGAEGTGTGGTQQIIEALKRDAEEIGASLRSLENIEEKTPEAPVSVAEEAAGRIGAEAGAAVPGGEVEALEGRSTSTRRH